FFFSSRRRHTSFSRDWSSDVCSSDLDSAWGLPQPYALAVAALLAILALIYWLVRRRRAARPVGVDLVVGDEEAVASERELSTEERRRQELHERVAALARERPEEVAQLVKAWLMEE